MSHILIEGIDRLGKGTLIQGLKNACGSLIHLHYQKPEHLDYYDNEAAAQLAGREEATGPSEIKKLALELYQRDSFKLMFHLLSNTHVGLVLDRAHLGEMVYAKRYRGYDGSYVFDLEASVGAVSIVKDTLVLLIASDLSYVEDDGLSFDFSKREAEQADFIKAFEASNYRNKLMIDVTLRDGNPGHSGESLHMHAPPKDILNAVLHMQNVGYAQKVSFISRGGVVEIINELAVLNANPEAHCARALEAAVLSAKGAP